MALTPEQKKLLDETIERRVAAAAARKIHRLIADDEADDWKGKRFAAVVTSVVLVAVVLCFAYFAAPSFLNDFRAGVASPDAHRRNTIVLFVGVALTVIVLWLAFYLAVTFPRPARFAKATAAAAAVLACAAGAAYWFGVPVVGSATGTDVHSSFMQTHITGGSGAVGALIMHRPGQCATFNAGSAVALQRSVATVEDEDLASRLSRRKRNWICDVQIVGA